MAPTLLTADRVERYLERIGLARTDVALSPAGLRRLHHAHLLAVPFENLDIHLGIPIVLEAERLVDKLLSGRGGFCYELNGAFAALLTAIGFTVTLLEARVYDGDEPGIRFDHLCLRVDLDEPWLADVGFGSSFQHPLPLAPGLDQADPNGLYRIAPSDEADWLDLLENGVRRYRFSLTPRRLADFEPGCHHHQTSPASHFTRGTVCSRLTAAGRITLRDTTLIETTAGRRTETPVAPEALLATYAARFGVRLPGLPVRSKP